MISTKSYAFACGMALTLFASAQCRPTCASCDGSSLRRDSSTGDVTRTYPSGLFTADFWAEPWPRVRWSSALCGSTHLQPVAEFWFLDAEDNVWYPPAFVDTFTTSGSPQHRSAASDTATTELGGTLIGISRNLNGGPPSHIFQYMLPPFSFDPFLINVNIPPGELPSIWPHRGRTSTQSRATCGSPRTKSWVKHHRWSPIGSQQP